MGTPQEDDKMSQNATRNRHKTLLSPRQLKVLGKLLQGMTISAAAKDVGISRETIHRWMRTDLNFQATLNRRKRNLLESMEIRLLKIANLATRRVEKLFVPDTYTDKYFLLDLLKDMGLLNGKHPIIGPDNPKTLRKEKELKDLEMKVARQNLRSKAKPRKKVRLVRRNKISTVDTSRVPEEQGSQSVKENGKEGA
jgi:hypothetical protein